MIIQVGSAAVEMIEHGDRVCVHMAGGGSFERRSLELWAEICSANVGRTVIDVGCYTGLYSIAAALLGCKVIAFEPMPGNVKRIINNSRANNVRDAIKLHKGVALSDHNGLGKINYNAAVTGLTSGASLVNARLGLQRIRQLDVKVRTLDSFRLRDVGAVKIDVERAEPEVLRGAIATIKRWRPTLIVEVLNAKIGAAIRELLPGYSVTLIDDGPVSRNWLLEWAGS